MDLPVVDEHTIEIDASVGDTWTALTRSLDRAWSRPLAATYARLIGAVDRAADGRRPVADGSTYPGFHVVSAVPDTELVLAGQHRFSTYLLSFRIEPVGPAQSLLRAGPRAACPGATGQLYELAVIRSGAHRRLTRRLLTGIGRRAAS